MQRRDNNLGAGVQKHGIKGQKGFSWADLGAAMDAENVQQSIKPSAENATKERNEAVTGRSIFELVQANGFRCDLSGAEMDPDNASIDHVVPLAKGGSHLMSNIAVIHMTVNRMKGDMDKAEFVRWCTLIARWNG